MPINIKYMEGGECGGMGWWHGIFFVFDNIPIIGTKLSTYT